MTYLNRDSAQKILDTRPQGTNVQDALKVLADKGFTIEGYNDGSKGSINESKPSALSQVVSAGRNLVGDIIQPFENLSKTSRALSKTTGQYLADKAKGNDTSFSDTLNKNIQNVNQDKTIGSMLLDTPAVARDITTPQGVEQTLGDVGQGLLNVSTLGEGTALKSGVKTAVKTGVKYGAGYSATEAMQEGKGLKDTLIDTGKGAVLGGALGLGAGIATPIIKNVAGATKDALGTVVNDTKSFITNTVDNVTSKIGDIKTPNFLPIDATENIKTSLNPFLTNTKAKISVPTNKGYVLKTVDKITPEEKIAVQNETSKLYDNMSKRAEEFKTDRRDILSPLEIVGQRTDKLGLAKVDKLRKDAGNIMGEIEKANANTPVKLAGTRLNTFIDEFLGSNKKYGRTMKDTSFMEDFAKDFDKLSQNPTAKETLDFTRTWTNELENLKDGFGQFKDNKRTYTLIEGALNDIKNNTRNMIADGNKEYAKALADYRLTSQIRDEGNRLLGKEGLSGEKIKGGALAKRAVQSSSDAGARQFFNILKKTTGYDGLKEADIAIQAMKDAGDYQGLSLLEVNKDLYNATLGKIISSIPMGKAVSETTKAITNKVVPQGKRIKNLINK